MKSYLVIGLESSCTRLVSKMIALNLGVIDSVYDWDGRDSVSSEEFSVTHRSLPHGAIGKGRDIVSLEYCKDFDVIIISTRDINCVTESKIKNHQRNKALAIKENKESIRQIQKILSNSKNSIVFSYEAAFILQEYYTKPFLNNLGIKNPIHVNFNNVNKKYLVGEKND
jgi:hypothetical protein